MDKDTSEALQEILVFAQQANTATEHADAHYKAFRQLERWMDEYKKEFA